MIKFPRRRDKKPHAWGLSGKTPKEVWERFSPSYEVQLERLVKVLEKKDLLLILAVLAVKMVSILQLSERHRIAASFDT